MSSQYIEGINPNALAVVHSFQHQPRPSLKSQGERALATICQERAPEWAGVKLKFSKL